MTRFRQLHNQAEAAWRVKDWPEAVRLWDAVIAEWKSFGLDTQTMRNNLTSLIEARDRCKGKKTYVKPTNA